MMMSNLSYSTHERLHIRGALAVFAQDPESSSMNLGLTNSQALFKITSGILYLNTFTPLMPEKASKSFSIMIGRNVSNLKVNIFKTEL